MHALPRRRSRQIDFVLLFLILLVPCVPAFARPGIFPLPHHDDRLHKEIEGLESEWRASLVHNDVSTAEHLLADDYLGINANGTLETKADAVASRRAGMLKLTQLNPTNLKIRVYGDTAVVVSRVQVQGTNDNRDISGLYRYTRVYNKRAGQWKIVSFEASRIQ